MPDLPRLSHLPDHDDEENVSDEEDASWYAQDISDIITLSTPLPPTFPLTPTSTVDSRVRPDSLPPPPRFNSAGRSRHSKPLPVVPRLSIQPSPPRGPSAQLDPTFPAQKKRHPAIPSRAPPPPPIRIECPSPTMEEKTDELLALLANAALDSGFSGTGLGGSSNVFPPSLPVTPSSAYIPMTPAPSRPPPRSSIPADVDDLEEGNRSAEQQDQDLAQIVEFELEGASSPEWPATPHNISLYSQASFSIDALPSSPSSPFEFQFEMPDLTILVLVMSGGDDWQNVEKAKPNSRLPPVAASSDGAELKGEPTPLDGGNSEVFERTSEGPPERQLNVTDALSYLDSVKVQFQDRPDVYNRFLDIMKDFKGQKIDTPGVIERVSTLFRGHPALIQGFNTFLPAGYRIECTTDSANPDFITVTTPSGTTTQAIRGSLPPDYDLGSRSQGEAAPSAGEIDIELALSYVQKVKNRYANDPDRYKAFLEILSPQVDGNGGGMAVGLNDVRVMESASISVLSARTRVQEAVVYRVSKLFKDDTDLMKGFSHFLPDRNVQQRMAAKLDELEEEPRGSDGNKSRKKIDGPSSSRGLPAPSVPQKRKRKPAIEKEKEKEREIASKAGPSKRIKHQHGANEATPSPSLTQRHAVPHSPRRSGHTQIQPQAVFPPHALPASSTRYDESQFFDRVKTALDNRETYNEFLKVVNLFTQDIIDTARLIQQSRTYLGDGELMVQFKEILGWDDRRERYAGAEDVWTRPTGVLDRPSRNQLNLRYGSYRKLPAHEVHVICSGRDDMCKSVLNDEWVSQPSFTSEDAGFLAHKKNQYEEALHRSEEERHEYDFHIEAINRTIVMLEPFNNKINQLSHEEKAGYKYKPALAGAAKNIHLRVIKKAIPLVLARLKQKHEEWKRAQREWNKVWKEVDAKNYYKSLDHQGITFKTADKKAITPKTFVTQIEAARDEQVAKRAALIDPLFARTRPRHQLEYMLEDVNVLQDGMKLVLSFLDRTQGQLGLADRKKIETFLRSFLPTFFMLDPATFNSSFVPRHEAPDSDASELDSMTDEVDVSSTSSSRGGRNNKKTAAAANDLRNDC
ncbi:hypothetical protein EW026_g3370 [Hermanssonia centrifuga]|uniref:Histone deacetylase interacting domain-containing protein n=1 Tax=Hermanssonia centrifuga TaxID=98765 RepID=A0A4S4KKD7_9APHY|nr:hypothetical protein EW026_g3370 [Hermanssonia centrifuga]